VTNEEYARHIAEHWNVKESGAGYVTRFAVREAFIAKYPVQRVGARIHTEYWCRPRISPSSTSTSSV